MRQTYCWEHVGQELCLQQSDSMGISRTRVFPWINALILWLYSKAALKMCRSSQAWWCL